jgi:hypothetical protein
MAIEPTDFYLGIGLGLIPGFDYVHKFGKNADIDAAVGTYETIWNGGGNYTGFNCTSASTIGIASTVTTDKGILITSGIATAESRLSLHDDNATFVSIPVVVGDMILDDTDKCHGVVAEVVGETELRTRGFDRLSGRNRSEVRVGDSYRIARASSTGASVVELQLLLDANLENQTNEFVIMDGTTTVTTTGEYLRNSRVRVLQAGSAGFNDGAISTFNTFNVANIFSVMPNNTNSTLICAYTIPYDTKSGHLVSIFASLAGKVAANVSPRLVVRHLNEVWNTYEDFSVLGGGSSNLPRNYLVPKDGLSPGSDLKIEADSDTNNTEVVAAMDIILKL